MKRSLSLTNLKFLFPPLFLLLTVSLSLSISEIHASSKNTPKKSNRPDVDPAYVEDIKKDWKFLNEKDHIYVFKKELKDSPMTAFRGVAIIPVPMDVLFHIVRDTDKSQEWTPNLGFKKMAKDISLAEGITYNMNTLPWPATDRETLLHSKLYYDHAKKAFVVSTKSVELPEYPENKDYVRGIVYESNFIFRPVPQGTLVDLDAHIDPKGTLPAWLINFIQEEWAYKFLTSLDKYATRGGFTPEAPFTAMMNAYLNGGDIDAIFTQIYSAAKTGAKVNTTSKEEKKSKKSKKSKK